MTAITTRTWQIGDRRVPVVLPQRGDPRLHTAAVIISVHIIGITALGFKVSVPQILCAILAAGSIDLVLTMRRTGSLVWPASGFLTGSGVALILRLVGMSSGDYWTWEGWYWFAGVAGVSVLTKYVVRYRREHVFNPSNIGLVLVFLLVGEPIVQPLDFWWAPLGPAMMAVYAIIIVGGSLITRRLHLLEMATGFWVALASGLAVLAASGHCMTATWSSTPVCGTRFWTVLVTSPETLIFLFFMITDPKTVPVGRLARLVFAVSLGLLATLMIAPHSVEFGAKVGLLSSLAVWSPLRRAFDRLLGESDRQVSGLDDLVARIRRLRSAAVFWRGVVSGSMLVVVAVAIVVAGGPAREQASALGPAEIAVEVDPATLPEVVVDASVERLDLEVDDVFVSGLALMLAENLAIEADAIRNADGSLLGLADGGARLDVMQALLDEAVATGERPADQYVFETLRLGLHESAGAQTSAGLVFAAEGSVTRVVYDALGAELSRTMEPFEAAFVLRQLAGDRWLLVDVEPVG